MVSATVAVAHAQATTNPPLVEQQTEFAPDHPAMIGETFAADLLRAPTFPDGVEQLDAIRVNDAEHGRSGQEGLGPVLRGPEEAQEPGALGEPRKQRAIVARQPPRERAVAHAFEGVEQPQGDHLTGPEVGLGMCGQSTHLFIDLVEQCGDKLHGGHTALLAWEGCHAYQRGRVVGLLQAQKPVLVVCIVLYSLSSL